MLNAHLVRESSDSIHVISMQNLSSPKSEFFLYPEGIIKPTKHYRPFAGYSATTFWIGKNLASGKTNSKMGN